MQNSFLPNVIRNAAIQVVGVLATLPALSNQAVRRDEVLIGLPGTRSKWVQIRHAATKAELTQFNTFMTCEVLAPICGKTILASRLYANDMQVCCTGMTIELIEVMVQATGRGLWQLALSAGLLKKV